MRTASRILFLWVISIAFIVVAQISHPEITWGDISDVLFPAFGSLAGIIACYLWRKEIRSGARATYSIFAILFLFIAFNQPIYQMLKEVIVLPIGFADFYFFWYSNFIYFFLVAISVVYIVMDELIDTHAPRFVLAFSIVLTCWTIAFYPFVRDPVSAVKRPEVRNVLAIQQCIDQLHSEGNASPTIEELASRTVLSVKEPNSGQASLSIDDKRMIVLSLLNYVPGENRLLLVYKPFWLRCSAFGLLNILFLVLYFIHQFVSDSTNKGAYHEKVVWCLLPYCLFDVIHMYSFTTVSSMEVLATVSIIGRYLSMLVICAICGVMALRLHFLHSVEGGYYERRLLEKPDGITRWRDGLDQWVLRHFMNPGDLDRRFVIRRRTDD